MYNDLKGKNVLITVGSKGISRANVLRFMYEGANACLYQEICLKR